MEIKSFRSCVEAIEELHGLIAETSKIEPGLVFTSLVAEEHFKQALTHLMMAKHSMALAELHDARELGNKQRGIGTLR